MSLSEDDYKSWRFTRDDVHFNGGSAFFGYGHRCIDQPRLLVIDKFFRKDRSTKRSWMVDGKTPCPTLAEALRALSLPPQPTEEQHTLLRSISSDWTVPERRGPLLPLAEMGLIEWGRDAEKHITCRLTVAGARSLECQP